MPTEFQLLVFKLVLTPILVGAASILARRTGPLAAGLLVGLPLTSGPVSVFLALEQGGAFAAEAASGTLAGVIAVAVFAVVYARVATRTGVTASLTLAVPAYFGVAFAVTARSLPTLWIAGAVIALPLALLALPSTPPAPQGQPHAWWEIPVRILVATTIVVGLTAGATQLGATVTGVLSPFPVFATVIGARLHHLDGHGAAVAFLRGVLRSLFSFVAFFVVTVFLVESKPLLITYGVAVLAAVVVQATVRWGLRRAATPLDV